MVESTDQPGVWVPVVTERQYYGDIVRNYYRNTQGQGLNKDVTLSNSFSILADDFALNNYQYATYVVYMGTKWAVDSVEFNYPRLTISVGGMYNEQ